MAGFHYSSYWGKFSRVLHTNHNPHPDFGRNSGSYVELDLTPHNWENWGEIKDLNIRVHGTARGKRDENYTQLPEHIRLRMVENLGEELVAEMLTRDFYSEIDWDLYRKHCNGGASFYLIRRG